ncbi:hypothetical protein OS493_040581 [Desmophyllum pertusum]|uniref:Uncharacterized protein n=1 Tax=Desmophyllum pertusum TaxID=174260 RepID=A0A9W9Z5S2_9CNID|nr:hypothetical protein OS493_040581 [Desmophyllum pertusum]
MMDGRRMMPRHKRQAKRWRTNTASRKDQAIYRLPIEDVKFSFELPDEVPIGKNVSVARKMKKST